MIITQPDNFYILAALAFLAFWIALFVLKTLLLWWLRAIGLHSPSLYRFLPRIPWRSVYRVKMAFALWVEQVLRMGKRSTGGFASMLATLSLIHTKRTVFMGRAWAWGFGLMQPVGIDITRHLAVFAMTGAGKTTWLMTMLAQWRGSAWVIDPKGQITAALARCDKKREWVVLNPYDPTSTHQWNPFDDIKAAMQREGDEAAVKWAMRLAQALIVTPAGSKQPYFADTSRGFVAGLALHMLSHHPEEDHTLGALRQLIVHGYRVFNEDGSLESTTEEAHALLHKAMASNPAFDGAVAGGAAGFISASGETLGNLASTLQEQTKWLDLPSVRHMLATTTRPLSEVKTRSDIVFSLVVPVLSLREELKPLLRLFTNFTTYTFEAVKEKKGQCMCIIDEVQAQGYNQTLEVALPVARSYGQTIVAIAQDLEGMKAAYPNSYQSFVGNADAVMWMGSNHPMNLQTICKTLGKRTFVSKDPRTRKPQYREVNVMEAEQIARLLAPEHGTIIVTRAGKRALRLKNDPYFKALPVTAYDPAPDHREPWLRTFSRFLLNKRPKKRPQS